MMATNVEPNADTLRRKLGLEKGRDYSWRQISEETGINYNVLLRFVRGQVRSVQYEVLAKLLDWFRAQGMQVEPGDFFTEGGGN